MKLAEFNFNKLKDHGCRGLSVFIRDKEVARGFTGDVLRDIPHLKHYEIKSTNKFFDVFVIRLFDEEDVNNIKEWEDDGE